MNWNDLSDDSWLKSSSSQADGNEEQNNEAQKRPFQQQKQKDERQKQIPENTINSGEQKRFKQEGEALQAGNESKNYKKNGKNEKREATEQGNRKPKKDYSRRDQQILQLFQKEEVEQKKKLKVVGCTDEKEKQILKKKQEEGKIKIKEYKQNCYVIKFGSLQSLKEFIKQKIEKGYKFKIGVYIMTENEKAWIAEKTKERKDDMERNKKQQYKSHRAREYRQKEGQEKQKQKQKQRQPYRSEKQIQNNQKEEKKEKQQKKERRQQNSEKYKNREKTDAKNKKKEEYKQKRNQQLINASFLRTKHKGQIFIHSDQVSPADFIWWLNNEKIPKQFARISISFNKNIMNYIEKVCDLCFYEINFGIEKGFSDLEVEKLQQKVTIYLCQLKGQNKEKQPAKLISYRFVQGVYIQKVGQEHFENIEKYNTHIIGSKENLGQVVDFNQKQYIQLFKKNSEKIITTKQKWIIYAYGRNIAKLLRLSGLFKKILASKNKYQYEVGVFEGYPYARFEICHLNKNKSVDASVVNNYLRDS